MCAHCSLQASLRAALLACLDRLSLALKHGPSGWDSPASLQEGAALVALLHDLEQHLGAEGDAASVAVLLRGRC